VHYDESYSLMTKKLSKKLKQLPPPSQDGEADHASEENKLLSEQESGGNKHLQNLAEDLEDATERLEEADKRGRLATLINALPAKSSGARLLKKFANVVSGLSIPGHCLLTYRATKTILEKAHIEENIAFGTSMGVAVVDSLCRIVQECYVQQESLSKARSFFS